MKDNYKGLYSSGNESDVVVKKILWVTYYAESSWECRRVLVETPAAGTGTSGSLCIQWNKVHHVDV